MNKKTKILFFISLVTFFLISILYISVLFNSNKNLESSSGSYYSKVSILAEGETNSINWDVGISKTNTKNNILECEINREILESFRQSIISISSKKFSIFILMLYLLLTFIILLSVKKDAKLSNDHKRSFYLIIQFLMIFIIYKVVSSSFELNRLNSEVIYYFNLIQ